MLKQALYDCFRLAIAVELSYRTFQAFPGAQSAARGSRRRPLTFRRR